MGKHSVPLNPHSDSLPDGMRNGECFIKISRICIEFGDWHGLAVPWPRSAQCPSSFPLNNISRKKVSPVQLVTRGTSAHEFGWNKRGHSINLTIARCMQSKEVQEHVVNNLFFRTSYIFTECLDIARLCQRYAIQGGSKHVYECHSMSEINTFLNKYFFTYFFLEINTFLKLT